MKLGVLFSGGKDSCYAACLAKKAGHQLTCLITIYSENKESYMFHTPSISMTASQASMMGLPLITRKTAGQKEVELADLEIAIAEAKALLGIEGVVTGALCSVYQASRIGDICKKLGLECVNPLWQKDQLALLEELVAADFEAIIVGVFAYPLTAKWLGRKIDAAFIADVKKLQQKYSINPAGEGGEFESFVLNCPLFHRPLRVLDRAVHGSGNSFWLEIKVA